MIEFKDFCFTYENEHIPALNSINLHINAGECVLITGLSGCGKTTLLRIINGLCPSVFPGTASGYFATDFYDYDNSCTGNNSKYVGSILQNPKSGFLFPNADDECKYSSKCVGKNKNEIDKNFNSLRHRYSQLMDHNNILTLSSGEAQTLSILSSYIKTPKIVIMDEPTANLDICEIEELKKHIAMLKEHNVTIIIAEHRVAFLKELCNKIYIMDNGTLVDNDSYKVRSADITFSNISQNNNTSLFNKLHIVKLNYSIKNKSILKNINLSIKSGVVTAIIGKNGSGKSTLGKCIAGLTSEKKALYAINNKILSKQEQISNTYFCMQESYHQMLTATVLDEINLQNSSLSKAQIKDLLHMMDMDGLENKHPSKLSSGQSLRLSVLLAYVSNCKVIILDEPSSGLDYKRMNCVCTLIRKMKNEGKFIILISHDLELLANIADEYILIDDGTVMVHNRLQKQEDFCKMIHLLKSSKNIVNIQSPNLNNYSKINPIVNLIVFFTMANAIFFYPSGQSSSYLMALLALIFMFNKNFMLSIKMTLLYVVLDTLKMLCPLYYQTFIEIFIIRGMMCGFAFKNLSTNTRLITIIESLEQIKLTDYLLIPIISFIRLFPTLQHDFAIAYMSLKTRKLTKNRNPADIWQFMIVPIIFSLMRSAENLSLGIETKGMIINKKRTLLTQVNFKRIDYILSVIYTSIYIFLILGGIR